MYNIKRSVYTDYLIYISTALLLLYCFIVKGEPGEEGNRGPPGKQGAEGELGQYIPELDEIIAGNIGIQGDLG